MAEKYPILFSKTATTYTGYGSALILEAQDVTVTKRVNAIPTLTFNLPPLSTSYADLTTDAFIEIEDELYIVREITQRRNDAGAIVQSVSCEGIISELIDSFISLYEGINVSVSTALSNVLTGTRFSVGTTAGVTANNDLFVEDTTGLDGLNKILTNWECEYVVSSTPDGLGKFPISLYPTIGSSNSVEFRYSKNLKGIKKTIDARDLVTRLYVFGKDGLGIEAANSGVPYLNSAYINSYVSPKIGKVQYNEIDDATELKAKGLTYLSKVETPKVSYEIDILELKKAGYQFETFSIGDTIKIIDPNLASGGVSARIVEYTYKPIEGLGSQVTLANFIDRIDDFMAGLQRSKNFTDSIQYRNEVGTYWLNGVIDSLQNQVLASGAYTNSQVLSGKGILLENTNSSSVDYGSVYLGPNIIAIANSKTGGNWNYTTFGTGAGFTANAINTGTLNASLVNVKTESNNTVIDASGITSTRSDAGKTARVKINATDGFRIEKNTGTAGSPVWSPVISLDTSGNASFSGSISATGSLSSASITGSTITGGLIRTSSGSSRVEMTNDRITGYASGTTSIEIRPDLVNPYMKCGNIYLYDYGITGQSSRININGSSLQLSYTGLYGYDGSISSGGALYLTSVTGIFLDGTNVVSALSGKANTVHTHSISDVTGLQAALDGKAPTSHTHTKSQITDFAHTHVISDVSGLQAALDGKATKNSSTSAETVSVSGGSHNHGISDGTVLRLANGGTVTWSAYSGFSLTSGSHTHTQN